MLHAYCVLIQTVITLTFGDTAFSPCDLFKHYAEKELSPRVYERWPLDLATRRKHHAEHQVGA